MAYAYRKAIIRVDQPGFVNCERLVPLLAPRFRFRSPKASRRIFVQKQQHLKSHGTINTKFNCVKK